MKKLHLDILTWIGGGVVTVDDLHAHIHKLLGDNCEFGDVGLIVNEMIAERLLKVDDSNYLVSSLRAT